jgi:hypothetical protein
MIPMATKNNPGAYDCYQNAEPDEPMFVLLGRDKHAPTLVWLWSVLRELDGEKPEKVAEARTCAVSMIEWLADHNGKSVGLGQSVLAGVLELIRGANHAAKAARNSTTDADVVRAFFTATEFETPAERC